MLKRILVTGASGFIGGAFCSYLRSLKGVFFQGIGRKKPKQAFCKNYFQLDLLDKNRLRKFLTRNKPSLIFHLAGSCQGDPKTMFNANIVTTINLFESIRSISRYQPRIIVIGSAAEYGNRPRPFRPISEQSLISPLDINGLSQALEIQRALLYAQLGEDVVIARFFNIMGPGTPDHLAAGRFARQIIDSEYQPNPKVFTVGNLSGVRDFLDIRDICEALYILSLKGKSSISDYQDALRSIQYNNKDKKPNHSSRKFIFSLSDGKNTSKPTLDCFPVDI